MVSDIIPHKPDPLRVCITVRGGNIELHYDVVTPTTDLSTAKILIKSTLSTPGAKWCGFDLVNMYLNTYLTTNEYLEIHISRIPQEFIDECDLNKYVTPYGWVFDETRKGMYGLPQDGILAHNKLKKVLKPHGYNPVTHTPGLWRHHTHPITFALVVDDFGVKHVGEEHARHLREILAANYEGVHADWTGKKFCGITLKWYYTCRTCELSMPGYILAFLCRFHHPLPSRPELTPYKYAPRNFKTSEPTSPIPEDETPPLPPTGITRTQKFIGCLLYYARSIDGPILPSLSDIKSEQSKSTEATAKAVIKLLN